MATAVIQLDARTHRAIEAVRRYPQKFAKALGAAMQEGAARLASAISESQFTGDPLQTRTGKLRASVSWKILPFDDQVVAAIGVIRGPARRYARIQEEGGTIKAAPGKALAIPLPAARTASGRPRYPGGPRQAEKRHPGEVFFLKRPGKPPLICRAKKVAGGGNRTGKVIPLFVLQKSVKLPATYWLSEGIIKHRDVWAVAFNGRMKRELD